jgi:hypothetical protein
LSSYKIKNKIKYQSHCFCSLWATIVECAECYYFLLSLPVLLEEWQEEKNSKKNKMNLQTLTQETMKKHGLTCIVEEYKLLHFQSF